jgi:triacylglycerol lipase
LPIPPGFTNDGVALNPLAVDVELNAVRTKLQSIGRQISPQILQEVQSLYAPLLVARDGLVEVHRDVHYGPHTRHRLNVFSPLKARATRDVLIFVHGGGFVTGDKEEVPGAFYDNVGNWAAAQGLYGVVINYRLAPEHRWPAGSEDVAAAVAWARDKIGGYGGNNDRLFLMGHSAGAAHACGYLADARWWTDGSPAVAGAICVSGIYDLELRPINTAYYGDDEALYSSRSPLAGLGKSVLPMLFTVAQNDPEFIERHTMSLFARFLDESHLLPRFAQIHGHNHFSTLLHLNTPDESLGGQLLSFIGEVS